MDGHFLIQLAVFLGVATFAGPIARMLKLGSILGYLLAGAFIGPYGAARFLGIASSNPETLRHTAELGVAMFLFLVGLQLRPKRLWKMRGAVFGVGAVQLAVTGLVLAGLIFWLAPRAGLSFPKALLIGLAVALGSTAFALQIMEEKGEFADAAWTHRLLHPAVSGYRRHSHHRAGAGVRGRRGPGGRGRDRPGSRPLFSASSLGSDRGGQFFAGPAVPLASPGLHRRGREAMTASCAADGDHGGPAADDQDGWQSASAGRVRRRCAAGGQPDYRHHWPPTSRRSNAAAGRCFSRPSVLSLDYHRVDPGQPVAHGHHRCGWGGGR